jgi:hypothetical protein
MICKVGIRQLRSSVANQEVRDTYHNEMSGLLVAGEGPGSQETTPQDVAAAISLECRFRNTLHNRLEKMKRVSVLARQDHGAGRRFCIPLYLGLC